MSVIRRFYFGRFMLYVNIDLKRSWRSVNGCYPKFHFSFIDQSQLPF